MIFQDPFSSLNPRMTIAEIIGEPLLVNGMATARHAQRAGRGTAGSRAAAGRLSEPLPACVFRRPAPAHRHRARAGAVSPSLIVADEPVSALDVSVQAQIVNLMLELQDRLGLAYLFVAHDLSVVKHVSHRVAVMYVGRIVEIAPTAALFATPRHPYTEALLSAVPVPDPRLRAQADRAGGRRGRSSDPPPGCAFHPRCRYAVERCKQEIPQLQPVQGEGMVACHRANELALAGVAADA